ncbi:tryptophan--tRNA ligase [Dialister micraerophilus DSM 19965]|uniref:Tryptophan--tRNA ligase n=2 Tax=Dialister micraerophilus TaxID=309120 RepID=F2BUZ7_9FIRM|nr:tryptophan--tRNA ligase [Dialister micraerophilus DSM 19965]
MKELFMSEIFKTEHTIDEILNKMGAKIVLNTELLSDEEKNKLKKEGKIVILDKPDEHKK